jgi:hypothetical protein
MAELWSDYTDMLVTGIDKQIGAKYKFSLRSLLTDPTKYATLQNVQTAIDNMKEEVNSYIDAKANALDDEKKGLDDAAAKVDSITRQLGQSINSQARQNNAPVIRPVMIERDTTKEENIYVDSIDSSVVALVQKLVLSSTLIADFSAKYKDYTIGSWLFSGHKNYMLNVYMPDNTLLSLEMSRAELGNLLDSASNFIKGL